MGASFSAPFSGFTDDSNTVLLLHMNGTNASTTFTDDNSSGRTAKTMTANGNAQISTSISKFGGASALFDGNGDYVTTGTNTSLNFGTADHTIECWVYQSSSRNNRSTIISNGVTSFTTNWMKFGVDLSGGVYYPMFTAYNYSSGGTPVITSSTGLSASTWYHLALVRYNTEWYMYLDGTQVGSNTNATAKGITASWNSNNITQIGRYSFDNGTNPASTYFYGNIDELRVSNNARYTAAFSPLG